MQTTAADAPAAPIDEASECAGLVALEAAGAAEAALFARKVELVHQVCGRSLREQGPDGPDRFIELDVAGSLRIGQGAASSLITTSFRLVQVHHGTLAGLRDGRVFPRQALSVLDLTGSCTEPVAGEVDRRLHAQSPGGLRDWTARRLGDRVRALVLQVEAELDEHAAEARLATARHGRRVSVRAEPDGMASLWALLPAEQLRQFTLGLDELTRRQKNADQNAGINRTADQRRADTLALLPALALHALNGTSPHLAAGDTCCTASAVVLNVHVPLATALHLSQDPGTLDGYGPISAAHARRLLPTATLDQVIVDDTTGRPLYTPTTRTPKPVAAHPAGAAADTAGDSHPAAAHPTSHRAQTGPAADDNQPAAPRPTSHPAQTGRAAGDNQPATAGPATAGPLTAPATGATASPAARAAAILRQALLQPSPPPRNDTSAQRPAPTGAAGGAGQTGGAGPNGHATGAGGAARTNNAGQVGEPGDDTGRDRLRDLLLSHPVHPEDVCDPDEGRYRPSAQLDAFIRLRDPLCTGPGCSTSSRRSDLDHLDPWPHGPTRAANLRPKSRRCHRAKTHTWHVTDNPDGSTHWHSPTGRTYTVPPAWTPPPTPRQCVGPLMHPPGPARAAAQTDTDADLTGYLDADLATHVDAEPTANRPLPATDEVAAADPWTPQPYTVDDPPF